MRPIPRRKPRHSLEMGRIQHIIGEGGWLQPFIDSAPRLSPEGTERILAGGFRVFSRVTESGRGKLPDWHLDRVNGHRFEKAPSGKIRINDIKDADCLFPCELSRLQFLLPLFCGERELCDESKADSFVKRVIDDWNAENPPGIGIHWRMHMELALRALSIVTVMPFLSEPTAAHVSSLAAECIRKVAAERILKPPSKRHNHYLIELVCSLIVSDVIRDRKILKARKRAFPALLEEIGRQFHQDGVNFECSLSYHRQTVEALLLLYSYLKSAAPKDEGAGQLLETLEKLLRKAVGFTVDYSACLGRSPQFGDSSDGRILFCGDYYTWNPLDHSYLLRAASNLGILRQAGKEPGIYTHSGYAFISFGDACVAACNPVLTEGASGHAHLDRLSWTLAVKGNPVFVDPGTWMYNSDLSLRNHFKSTASHNTVMIDGEEQAVTNFGRAFSPITGITVSMKGIKTADGVTVIEMSHTGYQRLKNGGETTRRIEMHSETVSVSDILDGSSTHSVSLGYLVHPRVESILVEGKSFRLFFDDLSVIVEAPQWMELKVEEHCYSPSYGEKEKAWRIVMYGRTSFPAELTHKVRFNEVKQVD